MAINTSFWLTPPWQGGVAKHRLGLRPMERAGWLSREPGRRVLDHKAAQLKQNYQQVVGIVPGHERAQELLLELPRSAQLTRQYPDVIADVSLTIAEDLCLLDVADQQRLIAACVCAPSYWRLRDKLGKPLRSIHAPVQGMNAKIGANIAQFIDRGGMARPFERSNWFVHADAQLYHDRVEAAQQSPVADWFVRCERQTLCRLSDRYTLFTINIELEPLAHIVGFPAAVKDLMTSLIRMDADEIEHFGGVEKHRRLLDYVASQAE